MNEKKPENSPKPKIVRKRTKKSVSSKNKNLQDNKKSFYIMIVKSDTLKYTIVKKMSLKSDDSDATQLDVFNSFMSLVNASDDWYLFSTATPDGEDVESFDYLLYFRVKVRTRPSSIQSKSKKIGVARVSGCNRDEWQQQLISTRAIKSKFLCERQPVMNDYNAKDLMSFEKKNYLYPWQNSIIEMLFEDDGDTVKSGDGRTIYSIVDMQGCKGKSSFIKWLCYKHPLKLGRLSYGTAAQLRSSIINLGPRQAYIVDLPRTRGKRDSLPDLLSAIEDLAGGFVTSPFRGASGQLMMEPPVIFVMSNFKLSYGLMSTDRWKIFEISQDKPYSLSEVTETLLSDIGQSDE